MEGFEASLDNTLGVERGKLQQPGGRLLQCAPRDQTDQFALCDFNAAFGGEASDGLVSHMERGLIEVGEVHGHLNLPARGKSKAKRLEGGEPSTAGSDGASDVLGDAQIGGVKVYVESDQEFACTHDDRACRGMKGGATEIRLPGFVQENFFADAFKLTAANIFEAQSCGLARGRLIEVDRDTGLTPDTLAGAMCDIDAGAQRRVAERNEGQHVERAQARMDALVPGQVNGRRSLDCGAHCRFEDYFFGAGEGDDTAIVIGVAGAVEQQDARHGGDDGDDGIHNGGVLTLGKVWDTFDHREFPPEAPLGGA